MNNVKIVLLQPSHPGNIGAAARAMKNMGFTNMRMVNPKILLDKNSQDKEIKKASDEAYARASGADDVLNSAEIYQSLEQAVADCHFVAMTTARVRHAKWTFADSREAADIISQKPSNTNIALVFGPERTGISNEDLDKSHLCIHIPTSEFSSLNLGMAVNLLCYELFMAAKQTAQQEKPPAKECIDEATATQEDMQGFYQHLHQTLEDIDFFQGKPTTKLMRKLRFIFQRSELNQDEVHLLRGIFSRMTYSLKQKKH